MTAPARRSRSTLFTVFAILAMAVQFVVALAPLAESRPGRSMAAHIENAGARGHYTHDDANCASCQARSIHGTTVAFDRVLPVVALVHIIPVDRAEATRAPTRHTPDNPRAPPTVI